jgi:hypothetical protein
MFHGRSPRTTVWRIGAAVCGLGLGVLCWPAASREPEVRDNADLAKMYGEDQAERSPQDGQPIDPKFMIERDRQRKAKVKALYEADALHTGKDYERAAMILQHGEEPEDFLLAHEFCVVALAKGNSDARWLAAATEDRFLMKIGRPQRFGTQYHSPNLDDPPTLYKVEPGVTDALRQKLGVPTLAQARKNEATIGKIFRVKKAQEPTHDTK